MANLFEIQDRRVIPSWRSFNQSINLGELNSFQITGQNFQDSYDLSSYISEWKLNKTVTFAAELVGAAIVNNKEDVIEALDAANFILSNEKLATKSQILLASKLLHDDSKKESFQEYNNVTTENLLELFYPELVRVKIREVKKSLLFYPSNPILYVELSRYYSILGQREKAISNMKYALSLAPNNRFVLRCASRLFVHYQNDRENDYVEFIHNILRKSPATKYDPWLTSAEISIATVRGRSSMFIKGGLDLINSKNIAPFNFTELASSIGTVELLNGSNKKSRELFKKSLISPNDNTLAQVEWAATKDKNFDVDASGYDVDMNFEALAFENFQEKDYSKAVDFAARWFIDMPFSKRPILFGANIATILLRDQDKSIALLKAGLISHPNDAQLVNNLAYSLGLDNRANEALDELDNLRANEIDKTTEICLTATRGLAYFRQGKHNIGRALYLEAIEESKLINNRELNWIAILNYAREEIFADSEYVEGIMEAVDDIVPAEHEKDIAALKDDLIKIYTEYKQGFRK